MKSDLPLQWSRNLLEKERNSTGSICKTGKFEIRGIAQRLRNRIHLDEIKEGDIIVENTYKKRTHQTRDAFLEALLPHDYPQEQILTLITLNVKMCSIVRVMLIRRPLTSIPRFVSSPYVL